MSARRGRVALTQRLLEPARVERRAAAAAAASAARGRALRMEMVDINESWKRRTDYLQFVDGRLVPILNTAEVDRIAAKSKALADAAVQQANQGDGLAVGFGAGGHDGAEQDEGHQWHHAIDAVEVAADEIYEL